jgi:hypothetical protein
MSRVFVADAQQDDGRRYVRRADEKLTALLDSFTSLNPTLTAIADVSRHLIQIVNFY